MIWPSLLISQWIETYELVAWIFQNLYIFDAKPISGRLAKVQFHKDRNVCRPFICNRINININKNDWKKISFRNASFYSK